MRTLNLGILAHVDAGKTSLTERLLYAAGVIDEIGSVDDGNTQTDNLALERQRGITIKAAVVSFVVGETTINLIDTPGHPDFIAEVERVLNVLDGAVLVISAVEGVQAQTRVLMRALQRLKIPTLIFVNKIDRVGADEARTMQAIANRLTPSAVAMGAVGDVGRRDAAFVPHGDDDAGFRAALAELLAANDDAILAGYVDDAGAVSYRQLRTGLAAQTVRALVHPVYFGSAITGAGIEALTAGITELLPVAAGSVDGPPSGTVFKVERGPAGEKIAFVRMFSGTVGARDRLHLGLDQEHKVTRVAVFERGSAVPRRSISAGQIGKLWGLGDVRIGDAIGSAPTPGVKHHFAPPTLETIVVPRRPSDRSAMHVALTQLAEQDPLINLRKDDARQEVYVSLYGEVQKEVIQQTLANDFGIDIGFRETTMVYIERPTGTGAALEIAPDPFIATIGLRVEPGPIGSGVEFRLEIEFGSLPPTFFEAIEESVRQTFRQGLYGWQVEDCIVTMTHSTRLRKWGTASTATQHRNLTPLVLMSALKEAGTAVCEPVDRFRLELPVDSLGPIMPLLKGLSATPQPPEIDGAICRLEGEIPAARVHELQEALPGLTRGEGVLESSFESYRPLSGANPTRPRSDLNPLDRKQYLLNVQRHVVAANGGSR